MPMGGAIAPRPPPGYATEMRCNIFYVRFQREESRLEEIQSTVRKISKL